MQVDILFAIMAVREVEFFAPIAKKLAAAEKLKVAFLTFHEAGDDILTKEGIPFFSLHKIKRSMQQGNVSRAQLQKIEDALNVRLQDLVVHEKLTAKRQDAFLHNKLIQYYAIMDKIIRENNITCVVQELGGFIAPQLLYYLSRYHGVDHICIEPAMFPKRVVFTLNSLCSDIDNYAERTLEPKLSAQVKTLVENYIQNKTVVIPKKDTHFFQDMGLKRLFSSDNFRRLSRKLYHKYVLGREEEYNAILGYVVYHIKKLYWRKLLNSHYSDLTEGERYIYFPFHVPLDFQLTVRCPEFLDQEALVEQIAKSIPKGYMLYIKEHPAAVGGHVPSKLQRLINLGNVRLLHPRNNSFDIIKNADCVVTINSKVGFESIMQNKATVVLGKTYYRDKGVTVDVEDMSEIKAAVEKALRMDVNNTMRCNFINKAFEWSCPGELYDNSEENVEKFYNSLLKFLSAKSSNFSQTLSN